ncbi:unnamed protein product, partial [Coregonus sp. 'balchen']
KLCEEVAGLRGSLEFSQSENLTLLGENKALTAKVKTLDSNMDCLLSENRVMRESLLDIQTRSMHFDLGATRPKVPDLSLQNLIKSRGRELKGSKFGLNDQFPREINERRKKLYPVQRQQRERGKRAFLIVDILFIDGQLF